MRNISKYVSLFLAMNCSAFAANSNADQHTAMAPASEKPTYFSFALDYLIMRSINENLAFDNRKIFQQSYGSIQNKVVKTDMTRPNRNWRPGFRVSMYGHLPYDLWTVESSWTYYYNKSIKSDHVDGVPFSSPAIDIPRQGFVAYWGETVTQGSATARSSAKTFLSLQGVWQLNYNDISLLATRKVPIASFVCLEPKAGLENTWINQKFNIEYTRSQSTSTRAADMIVTAHNKFWGIGPSFALDTKWNVMKGLNVVTGSSARFLYGRTTVRLVNALDITGGQDFIKSVNTTNRVQEIAPGLSYKIGLSWDQQFENTSVSSFSISAMWESIYYWGQFRNNIPFLNVIDSSRWYVSEEVQYPFANSGLQIEGVSVQASLGF